MIDQVKEHRVPIAVTVGALVIAAIFAAMPARENSSKADARAANAATDQIAALETRIAALETTLAPDEAAARAPTREELDLIVKGLVNQTGRVSRLQNRVDDIVSGDVTAAVAPRIDTEIGLVKRALVNLTRRTNGLKAVVETTSGLPGDVDRLDLRLSNVESAVTQLHRRIRALQSDASSPSDDNLDDVASQLEAILLLLQDKR